MDWNEIGAYLPSLGMVFALAVIIAAPELFGFIARYLYHKHSRDFRYAAAICAAIFLYLFPLREALFRSANAFMLIVSDNWVLCLILAVYGFFFTMWSASKDPVI